MTQVMHDRTIPPPSEPGLTLGDYRIAGGRVTLVRTGNSAALDARLLHEVAVWLVYHALVCARGLVARRRPGPRVWFTPTRPHPRYMIRTAAIWGGIRLARSPADADVAIFFDDATTSPPPQTYGLPTIGAGCLDIGKSCVAAAFARVFGYALALDPREWTGPAVAKLEDNGTHSARIVECPTDPRPGFTYQRLVETVRADGFAYEYRAHCVDHRVVTVWEKQRGAAERFQPPNRTARTLAPDEAFDAAELALLARFTRAMRADWCGLDVLRDRDGRIYVVDVNTTDAGPIIALPLRDKLAGTARLAAALRTMIGARLRAATATPTAPGREQALDPAD